MKSSTRRENGECGEIEEKKEEDENRKETLLFLKIRFNNVF